MAIYRIFPDKTATIYSRYPFHNTGLDEIIEVDSYYVGEDSYVARTLISFDTTEQKNVIETEISSSTSEDHFLNFSASLKLYLAEGEEVPTSYTLEAYPLYDDWERGTGKFGDIPYATDGASWINANASEYWTTPLPALTTGSYSGSDAEGGVWYTGSKGINTSHTQTHSVSSTHDVNIDVSPSVKLHYSQSLGIVAFGIPNNGFILKLDDANEFQTSRNIFLKYFSANTHTIYPPCLEFKWNDYTETGNLSEIVDPNCIVQIKNNQGRYTDEGKRRFDLHVRPANPARTFATSSNYLTNYFLPTASYWGLRDENTEEMVVDFDTTFTKISRGANGNFFNIYMNGLQPERHYRLLIKSNIQGSTNVIDSNMVFKVVRNG